MTALKALGWYRKGHKRGDGIKRPWHSPLEVTVFLALLVFTAFRPAAPLMMCVWGGSGFYQDHHKEQLRGCTRPGLYSTGIKCTSTLEM